MKTADLLQRLNLKIMAKNARIRDLELENADLKRQLEAEKVHSKRLEK